MRAFNFMSVGVALALAVPLTACDTMTSAGAVVAGLPAAPSQVCDRTTWDESAGTAVELSYKAFRLAVNFGVDAGKITGATATRARDANRRLFGLTQAVQRAYAACNSDGYLKAVREARAAFAQAMANLPGGQ